VNGRIGWESISSPDFRILPVIPPPNLIESFLFLWLFEVVAGALLSNLSWSFGIKALDDIQCA